MQSKIAVANHAGGPEVLHIMVEDLPAPGPDEVQVRVLATGVAAGDLARRAGKLPGVRFPFSPGYDVAGVVERVGAAVTDLTSGQMVAGFIGQGGNAEFVNAPARKLLPVPAGIADPARVVAAILNYLTAYQMLVRVAGVQSGAKVLIHGAAGGVGTALLQLAALDDITVYGTASAPKHELVQSLGGIPIDYRTTDFVEFIKAREPNGLQAAFDSIGGANLLRSFKTLGRGGTMVSFGWLAALNGPAYLTPLSFLLLGALLLVPGRSAKLYSISADHEHYREDLGHILSLLAQEKIAPVIGARLPLASIVRAHDMLEKHAVSGKIVLVTGTPSPAEDTPAR